MESEAAAFCVRHGVRAAYVVVVVMVGAVVIHFILSPLAKACVIVTLPETTASRAVKEGIWEEAQKHADAPLLWPRIVWPAFGLLLPVLILGCTSPAWGKRKCWNEPGVRYVSQVIVVLSLILYTVIVRVHVVPHVRRATYAANVDIEPSLHVTRLPQNPCQPLEAFMAIWRGIFIGRPLFDEYCIGDWSSTVAVLAHGGAFEDFIPEYGATGEWHLIFQDVILGIASGVGPLFSDRVQILLLGILELYGLLWAYFARPHANIALNVVLLLTKAGQTLIIVFLLLGTFVTSIHWAYWAVVIVELAVLLLTLVLPTINAVSQLLIFTLLRASCQKSSDDIDTDLDYAVSTVAAISKGLCFGTRNSTSFCDAYCRLLGREITYVTSWFFCCAAPAEKPPPASSDDDVPMPRSEGSRNEFHLNRSISFDPAKNIGDMDEVQLQVFIESNGGTYDDCTSSLELRLRAEDIAQRGSCHILPTNEEFAIVDDEAKSSHRYDDAISHDPSQHDDDQSDINRSDSIVAHSAV